MKDKGQVVAPWSLRALLLGMVLLLLLGSGGLGGLLLAHRDLAQHVARLQAQLQVVARSCGSTLHEVATEAVDRGAGPDTEGVHRGRRRRGAEPPGGQDQDMLMMMMMTYSRVPLKRFLDLCNSSKGICLTGPPGPAGPPGEKGEPGPKGETGPRDTSYVLLGGSTNEASRQHDSDPPVTRNDSSVPRPWEEYKGTDKTSVNLHAKTAIEYVRELINKTEPTNLNLTNNKWEIAVAGSSRSTTELPPMYSKDDNETSSKELTAVPVFVVSDHSPGLSTTTQSHQNTLDSAEEEGTQRRTTPMRHASSTSTTTQQSVFNSDEEEHITAPIKRGSKTADKTDTDRKTNNKTVPVLVTDNFTGTEEEHLDKISAISSVIPVQGNDNLTGPERENMDTWKISDISDIFSYFFKDGGYNTKYKNGTESKHINVTAISSVDPVSGNYTLTGTEKENIDKISVRVRGNDNLTGTEKENTKKISDRANGTNYKNATDPKSFNITAIPSVVRVRGNDNLTENEKENRLTNRISDRANDTNYKTATDPKPVNITDSLSPHLLQNNDTSPDTGKENVEKNEHIVKTIMCSDNVTQMQSTFGAWMPDAAHLDEDRFWLLEHFSGRVAVEYANISSLQMNKGKATDLEKFYQGCGHVIYNGSLYFHNAGTNKLLKLNLETRKTSILIIENTRYRHRSYLFQNSKTYFKFAVDENGLWVIAAHAKDETLVVAKINYETFSITSMIYTSYNKKKAGNGFIAHGILYITDSNDQTISHAFDLEKKVPLIMNCTLRQANGILAMLSYYPQKQVMYMWDNSSVKMCKINFTVLKKQL